MKNCLFEDKLTKDMATPFFVLDLPCLYEEVEKIKKAIKQHWPNTIIAYSVKTNSLPFLAKIMCEQGLFAEVVSQDEYDMVNLCGYNSNNVVCNGPVKSKDFIINLMDNHAIINIDSHREIDFIKEHALQKANEKFSVGIRVNVDVEKYFPKESKAGNQGSRFGFCMENNELNNAICSLQAIPNVSINGLHLHVSTSTRRVEIYRWLSKTFASIVRKFKLNDIQYFDIGGGFYGGIPEKPQWEDYLETICDELNREGFCSELLTLIMEPGVSLLAGAFSYYTRVVDVKETNRSRFVVTDGSRIHIDPFFHKKNYYYQYYKLKDVTTLRHPKQIIVGFTCLEYDNIMELDNYENITVGDMFRFDKLGAYTLSLSPQFISFSPAVYAVGKDKRIECVRRKLMAQDFVSGSLI